MNVNNKILLVIPAYNCEKQIARTLEKINLFRNYFNTIIIIDNNSTDDTLLTIQNKLISLDINNIKLFKNEINYGLGGSHKIGFDFAVDNNFDFVVILHGDDQADIADITDILYNNIHLNSDCILGSRFMNGSRLIGYSHVRTYANIFFNFIYSLLLKNKISDLGSGLNIYKTDILRSKFYKMFPDDLTFNYCMIIASSILRHKILFIPISWRDFDQISNVKIFKQTFNLIKIIIIYIIKKENFIKWEFRNIIINNYISNID